MRCSRGFTLLELVTVVAVVSVLAALAVIPAYRSYSAARAADDAAQTLAQDISLAERVAQNGGAFAGATIQVVSAHPLAYECLRGRPSDADPQSSLGEVVVRRQFDGVALVGGPIGTATPLLFASNGSAQFQQPDGTWPDQHQTIQILLSPAGDTTRSAAVALDLFTGAVSLP